MNINERVTIQKVSIRRVLISGALIDNVFGLTQKSAADENQPTNEILMESDGRILLENNDPIKLEYGK